MASVLAGTKRTFSAVEPELSDGPHNSASGHRNSCSSGYDRQFSAVSDPSPRTSQPPSTRGKLTEHPVSRALFS